MEDGPLARTSLDLTDQRDATEISNGIIESDNDMQRCTMLMLSC